MRRLNNKKQHGFTLLELMVTISILAILATIAMPSYRNLIERQKVRAALNEWQSAYYFAQREAMRLKQPVTFCGSEDGEKCTSNKAHVFSKGWIVFYEEGTGGKIQKTYLQDKVVEDNRINISMSNTNVLKKDGFVFMANGRLKAGIIAGTLTVDLNGRQTKQIKINAAGRLSAG